MKTTLKIHPFADLIPRMLRDEYVELCKDIKANGLRQPLVLFDGKVLDGRHRLEACQEVGIEPKTIEFTGTRDEAKAFVMSANVHRRHLSLEQKVAIVQAELKANPAQSDRTIAKKAKVSPTTVGKARAEANVHDGHKTERIEASGRKARGRKPGSKKPTASADVIDVEAREVKDAAPAPEPTAAVPALPAPSSSTDVLLTIGAEDLVAKIVERGDKFIIAVVIELGRWREAQLAAAAKKAAKATRQPKPGASSLGEALNAAVDAFPAKRAERLPAEEGAAA